MGDNGDPWMGLHLNSSYSSDNVSAFRPGVPTLGDNDSCVMDVVQSSVTALQGDMDPYMQVLDSFQKGLLRLDKRWVSTMLVLYVVMFVFSLAGNIIALLVILAENRLARSTNTFLLNLTIADLLGKPISPLFFVSILNKETNICVYLL